MPYIVTRCWYPLNKADQVAKKYIETIEKYPPDESLAKTIVPAAINSSKGGLEALMIQDVETQKVGEAIERGILMMIEMREIEGFTYQIKPWSKVEEALQRIGLGGN
jgi:hypothetical protein